MYDGDEMALLISMIGDHQNHLILRPQMLDNPSMSEPLLVFALKAAVQFSKSN